jgi:hypothetical protein
MFWRGVLPPLVSVTVVRTISLSTAGVLTRRSASARERCCRTRYASCLRSVTVIRTISFSIAGVLAGRIAFAGQRYYRTHHVLQHLPARQVHCRGWHCDSISSTCLVPAFQADQTQRATDREDPWGGLGMFTLSLDVASVSVRDQYNGFIKMRLSPDCFMFQMRPFQVVVQTCMSVNLQTPFEV